MDRPLMRRSGPGPTTWLVVAALVVGAAVLLAMAAGGDGRVGPLDGGPPEVATTDGADGGPAATEAVTEPTASGWAPPTLAAPADGVIDVDATAAELPRAVAALLVERAPVVVTAPAGTGPELAAARELATGLHAPLVLTGGDGDGAASASPSAESSPATSETSTESTPSAAPTDPPAGAPSVADLLGSWATDQVVAVGTPPPADAAPGATVHQVTVDVTPGAPSETATSASDEPSPDEVTVTRPEEVDAMLADAAAAAAPEAMSGVAAVVRPGEDAQGLPGDLATTLALAGVDTIPFTGNDPRASDQLRTALAEPSTLLLAVGDDTWPTPARSTVDPDWTSLFTIAATGPELAGGGQLLFPRRALIASYGNPNGAALGVLGERDVEGSIAYTEDLAADYEGLFGDTQAQPAFEIIATVASGEAGSDGDYSREEDIDLLTEWVDAADEAGVYVLLDLQSGRADFLSQAKTLEDLLRRPNVGLALDPEWRLADDEVHLDQIGTVTTAEVNEVSAWLAEIVRDEVLPEKLFLIHGFRLSMLTDRQDLDFHPELATMLQMDGQGAQTVKDDTWEVLTTEGPDQLWWGWKNFFDEDSPETRTPEDTAALEPTPYFISYQ